LVCSSINQPRQWRRGESISSSIPTISGANVTNREICTEPKGILTHTHTLTRTYTQTHRNTRIYECTRVFLKVIAVVCHPSKQTNKQTNILPVARNGKACGARELAAHLS